MVETSVLVCDPSSISFQTSDSGEECTPLISSPTTLSSLQSAKTLLVNDLQPIAFPTETVYGLAANALSSDAVLRIFSTKGRPADNPLIVHVSSIKMLRGILPEGYEIPRAYTKLISAFWPGALTLLFPVDVSSSSSSSVGDLEGKRRVIPREVTAGHATVAVRMPSHPVARALIALCDVPLAAPSANSSGKPSPTRAEHVQRDLGGKIGIVLDGGACEVGLESTVVDGLAEDGCLRVLRPGGVTVEEIERVFAGDDEETKVLVHRRDYKDEEMESAPTTPGMKYRHYAPSVPVILLASSSPVQGQSEDANTLISSILERFPKEKTHITFGLLLTSDSPFTAPLTAAISSLSHPPSPSSTSSTTPTPTLSSQTFLLGSSTTPALTAQRLFDGLLTLDQASVDVILVESIEEQNEGLAVMNRIRKAAGETRWISVSS